MDHPNLTAVEEFMGQLDMDRPIVQTKNWRGAPVADAYTASWHDQETKKGFTVICFNDGVFLALPEMAGGRANAADFGRFMQAFVNAK